MGAAFLILLISLLPAGVVYHRVRENVTEREQIRFDSAVRAAQRSIEVRIRSYLSGMFRLSVPHPNDPAERARWEAYFDGLKLEERFPGLAGVAYAPRVSAEGREAFEMKAQTAGMAGFRVEAPAGRTNYLPVVYAEAAKGVNALEAGLDLQGDAEWSRTLARALQSGRAEFTGKITLGGQPEQAGFGILSVVYRDDIIPKTIEERHQSFAGCVVTMFRVDQFFTDVLGQEQDRFLHFAVFDGAGSEDRDLIFSHSTLQGSTLDQKQARGQSNGDLVSLRQIRVGDHLWTLLFATTPAFEQAGERHLPWLVLVGSIAVSGALFGVALTQVRARRKLERVTEDLRKSQERDRLVERATNDVIWDWDLEKNNIHWNEALQSTFGYAAHKISPTIEWWEDKIHPDDLERVTGGLKSALETGGGFWADEYRFRRGDGAYATVIDRGYVVHQHGKAVRMIGSMMDISDRKRAEQARWQSEQKLRLHVQQTPLAVIEWDLDFRVTAWNPAAEKIFGYSAGEAVGHKASELIVPDSVRVHVDTLWGNLLAQRGGRRSTNENRTKDGRKIICDWYNTPLVNADGNVIGVASLAMEVTESRRMSEALAAEKERLAVTLRSIGEGVIATDINEKVILLNKVAERLTGCRQVDAVGKPVTEIFRIVHGKNRDPYENPVTQVLRASGVIEMTGRSAVLQHAGGECTINFSCSPIRNDHSEVVGTVLVFRDVTDELRATEELLRASKLESLGVLAGGIAHDFNNILTVVVGNLSFAKLYANPSDRMFPRLTEAEKAAIRARDLTHQLLTFAKGGSPIKQTASITELIKENVGFALHGSNVRCDLDLPEGLWPVEVDEGQIGQVVENLVLNGVQAMPNGGVITVSAANEVLARDSIMHLLAGKYVHLSIHDQGTGIRPDHLSKIFDPYFTTKPQGSGLGLASSYSIVKNHGGVITVESVLGVGSTFHVYLPASVNPVEHHTEVITEVVGGHGRVLVMDDDERIRELATSMLQTLGYDAEMARTGEEAIRMTREARDAGRPYRVIIMDLTIPGGMGGKDAVKVVKQIDPNVMAVVSSGYSNDPVMGNYRDYGFHGVLAKPYKMEDLARELRRLTDAPAQKTP
ncbi:MAG: PAS domain S-box protein [Verrucomicrobiota bacterium]